MTPKEKDERLAVAENNIGHLQKAINVIFKEIKDLPVKIGKIIDAKLNTIDDWKDEEAKKNEDRDDKIKELTRFKQKIEDYWKIISIVIIGVGAVMGYLIDILFKSLA